MSNIEKLNDTVSLDEWQGLDLPDDLCRRIEDFESRNEVLQKSFKELQQRIIRMQAQGEKRNKYELVAVINELGTISDKLSKLNREGEKINREIKKYQKQTNSADNS